MNAAPAAAFAGSPGAGLAIDLAGQTRVCF
jgi:hypothetical protein